MAEKSGQGRAIFLSVPVEIRHAVWNALTATINIHRNTPWFMKPKIEYTAVRLTCQQLHEEIESFRPERLITFGKYRQFHNSLSKDLEINYNNNISKYRSITIEFRLDTSPQMFNHLARALSACAPALEELHLSFVGNDEHGTPTRLRGCGNAVDDDAESEAKLPYTGQRKLEAIRILSTLLELTQMRILVISNLNFPLLAAVFQRKPRLEYLHITSDPRSALYPNYTMREIGPLISVPHEFFPPTKVISIAANSMINAHWLPSVCALTLEHLTWTVPDPALESNAMRAPLFRNTRQLMDNLALNARKLHTLRICIGGEGPYERPLNGSELVSALSGGLNQLATLKALEVHLKNTFLRFDSHFLAHLPIQLERLYVSDLFLTPRELHNYVTTRFLRASTTPQQFQVPDPEEARFAHWSPMPPLAVPLHDDFSEHDGTDGDATIRMRISPDSHEPIYVNDEDEPTVVVEVLRNYGKNKTKALYLPGIIGEDYRRKDYIPMSTGKLGFVAYEFRNPEHRCRTEGIGETLTQMVLRLNGRLLDRERNRHLIQYDRAHHIHPRSMSDEELTSETKGAETATCTKHHGYSLLLHDLHGIEATEPRDAKAAKAELDDSPFTVDPRYFGREAAAEAVFARERPARPHHLPPLSSVYMVDSDERDDRCQWMCPEASVPTLARLREMKARKLKV